jgi:hypothetical protein
MRVTIPLALLVLAASTGCDDGIILGNIDDINTVEELRDICDRGTPEEIEFEVFFEATEGCAWGQNGNDPATPGLVAARTEQTVSIEIPEGGVVCDLDFDFAGLDPGVERSLNYDDHFFLNLNGIVLAASYGAMVDEFETIDDLALYDWNDLKRFEIEEHGDIDDYCVGEDEGLSECSIPESESGGPISLAFGGELVDRMSLRALEAGEYTFQFVAVGDDNDTDCAHDDFVFTVAAPVVTE